VTAGDGPPTRHDPDVLVVGGGVVGLFCAYHLRRRGAGVTVVERGAVGGPGSCSSGNTGFVGTQGAAPLAEPAVLDRGLPGLLDPDGPLQVRPRWDGELPRWLWHFRRACTEEAARASFGVLLEMKRRSLAILHELCAAGGLASTFTAGGILVAFRTPAAFEQACRSVPRAVAGGVPLRVLGPGELAALEPDVEFDVCGALLNEEGAYLHLPDFLRELARTLRESGVEVLERCEVVGFEAAGGEVTGVRTTRGDFRPRETVLAAGSWSAGHARALGVPLPLQPAKGHAVTVEAPPKAPRLPVVLSEARVAAAPLGDRLRLGGTVELSGMDGSVSRRRVDGILDAARSYLPGLGGAEPVETWTGLRPCTPDGLPLLGRADPYRNLTVACGHGPIGMGLAPAGGELVARLVAGERPDTDPAPFRVGRYRGWRRAGHQGGRP
jgi:D-amino-acid dehydrogenase